MSNSSRKGKPLFRNMVERYFAVPQVQAWLLRPERRVPKDHFPFENPLAYACMYYPPSSIPRAAERYPLPKPFLDMGDVLLCQYVYDGIAVGTLYNRQENHALATVRDSILDSQYRLSGRPRTRNFAVDLRVKQLEVVEFAWMEDYSLIIACRRLADNGAGESRFSLCADLRFYGRIPPGCCFSEDALILHMSLEERTVICDFCSLQGLQSCICANSMKQQHPQLPPEQSLSDAVVPVRDQTREPIGPPVAAIGSWKNYTRAIFNRSQTGSFFLNSEIRAPNGKMVPFPTPKHPVPYRFVCGHPNDAISLVRLYVQKTTTSPRNYGTDTYLYGNGLSRGSHIGMITHKNDDTYSQQDVLQEHACNTNTNSYSHDDNILSVEISNHVATEEVPSQTTLSEDTLPGSEYGRLYTSFDVVPPVVLDPSQCTDERSLFNTRPNEDSPSSILLDRDEGWISRLGEMPEILSDRMRLAMGMTSDGWPEANQDVQPVTNDQPTPQPRPLSTSSRKIQEFMTVDAAERPTCRTCKTSFLKRGNLSRHIQTVHLKLKPFGCNLCTARFGYKAHLKRHMNVHQRNWNFRRQGKLGSHSQTLTATKSRCQRNQKSV